MNKSSLSGVDRALLNEEAAADHELDRLTLWMRNVEGSLLVFISPYV